MPPVVSVRGRPRFGGLAILHAVTGTWLLGLISHAATRFRMLYTEGPRTK
jgi:hypothetical protein